MGNLIDYLDWRGDLPFTAVPMGEADALILSCLSYINYRGIVPSDSENPVTIKEASECFFSLHSEEELERDISLIRNMPSLLRKTARTARYRDVTLSCYIDDTELENDLQFAAVTLTLPDESVFLSFRGTDDTIVGWKEDFQLSAGRVSAQKKASIYAQRILQDIKWSGKKPPAVYLGGHSKGGNLAEYAAAMCPEFLQSRISAVFDMDGPGFDESFLQNKAFLRVKDRIRFFVPTFSIIGMLMHHLMNPVIVHSPVKSIMAHDAFTWQILGAGFIRDDHIDETARIFNISLEDWVNTLEPAGRRDFVDDFFGILEASGCKTLTELREAKLPGVAALLARIEKTEPLTRKTINNLLRILFDNFADSIQEEIRNRLGLENQQD